MRKLLPKIKWIRYGSGWWMARLIDVNPTRIMEFEVQKIGKRNWILYELDSHKAITQEKRLKDCRNFIAEYFEMWRIPTTPLRTITTIDAPSLRQIYA